VVDDKKLLAPNLAGDPAERKRPKEGKSASRGAGERNKKRKTGSLTERKERKSLGKSRWQRVKNGSEEKIMGNKVI